MQDIRASTGSSRTLGVMSDDDYNSRLHAFETLLDPGSSSVPGGSSEDRVELNSFRRLCSRGIPSHPPHLRPQSYFLLLSLLPAQKAQWEPEKKRLRRGYYELVRAHSSGLEKLYADGKAVNERGEESEGNSVDRVKSGAGWLERKETLKERERRLSTEDKILLAIAGDIATLSSVMGPSNAALRSAGAFFGGSRRPKRLSALNPLGSTSDGEEFAGKKQDKGKRVNGSRISAGSVLEEVEESSDTSGDEDEVDGVAEKGEGSARTERTSKASEPKNRPYGDAIANRRAIFKHLAALQLDLKTAAEAAKREEQDSRPTASNGRSLRPALEQRETLFDYGASPSPSVGGREDSDDEDLTPQRVLSRTTSPQTGSIDLEVPKTVVDNASLQSPTIILSPSQDGEAVVGTAQRRKRLPRAPEVPSSASKGDPVTLLDSQTLLTTTGLLDGTEQEDLSGPDTYAESLLRLVCVFTRTHKRWRYSSSVTHVAAAFLRIYASGGDVKGSVGEKRVGNQREKGQSGTGESAAVATSEQEGNEPSLNGWQRHAEANAYWALTGIMNELGGIIAGSSVEALDANEAVLGVSEGLSMLRNRVRWADGMLWRGLTLRGLDPGSPSFAHRWIASLFSCEMPLQYLMRIWDFVLAEQDVEAKSDAIVDLSTAMLFLVKRDLLKRSITGVHPATAGQKGLTASLWADSSESPLVDYGDQTRLTVQEKAEAYQRGLSILRDYPVQRIGVHEVLKFAWEIKQERVMATLDGQGPDNLPSDSEDVEGEEDLYGYLAPLGGIAQRATDSFHQATTYGVPIASSLSASGEKIKQYTQSFQDSDAAAVLAKASTNFSVAALSRWATIGKRPSLDSLGSMARQVQASVSAPEVGSRTGDTAAGKIWNSISGTASPKRASLDQDKFTALPPRSSGLSPELAQQGADLYRRDSSLPPSFISHRGSIVYPAGRYRQRGGGAFGVQSRLQAIASNISKSAAPASPPERSVPKPLILGAKSSDAGTQSAPIAPVKRTGIERSRFRHAPKSSGATPPPISQGSESESGPDGQRYALTDHGAAKEVIDSPIDQEQTGHQKKYSLTDAPAAPAHPGIDGSDLSRQNSGDSFQSMETAEGQQGLARKKVIRKGRVATRPTNLKMRKSMESVASSEGEAGSGTDGPSETGQSGRRGLSRVIEGSMPSPLLEEEAEPIAASSRPTTIRTLPRSARMVSGPRQPAGAIAKPIPAAGSVALHPIKFADSVGQAADAEDEVEGDKSFDSTVQAKDGYGDLLESYGQLGDF